MNRADVESAPAVFNFPFPVLYSVYYSPVGSGIYVYMKIVEFLKKYWFVAGLILIFTITMIDKTETVSFAGKWLKSHHGPDAAIIIIFFVSGLMLNTDAITAGLKDIKGVLLSLALIFVLAPGFAALISLSPISHGLVVGIILVSVVPTTLSSGLVMTGAAGGNMAHALLITILANLFSVFSIPVELSLLVRLSGDTTLVLIDKVGMMLKIGGVLLCPLCCGLFVRPFAGFFLGKIAKWLQHGNQTIVLLVVWMALSQVREVILQNGMILCAAFGVAVFFHGLMLCAGWFVSNRFKLEKGKRESVILLGGQKTLPLSIMLQVSFFPEYGSALLVCVMHHMMQLVMDGYMVEKMK